MSANAIAHLVCKFGLLGRNMSDGSPEQRTVIDFGKAFNINGVFHTIENIQKRLLVHIKCWEAIKKPLESMCFVFHRYFTRRRFIRRCLGPAQGLLARSHFSFGVPMFTYAFLEVAVRRKLFTTSASRFIDLNSNSNAHKHVLVTHFGRWR